MKIYDNNFFNRILEGSLRSAENVVPIILQEYKIESAIDFGCGTGAWLSVFKKYGVKDIVGLDGYKYDHCLLDENEYKIVNLSEKISLEKKYSLSISLEVAEHLPESSADTFVYNVSTGANLILWSAATPGQGGDNHINEQPFSYWTEKFNKLGFIADLNFKNLFADCSDIEPWYRNNIIIFKKI
jgi:hypothetical protein